MSKKTEVTIFKPGAPMTIETPRQHLAAAKRRVQNAEKRYDAAKTPEQKLRWFAAWGRFEEQVKYIEAKISSRR